MAQKNLPPWWARTTVYQVYLRSFLDTNGDGVGDLPGITSKLDALRDLGVETLWICPFYASPNVDGGYDISDYDAVSPEYGTMDDVRRLVDEAHARGMRVLADMVLNHTSIEHAWFRESRSSRTNPKRDWYIWREGKRPRGKAPPNNWRSILGPRGWHWDERTEEWFWATFLPCQPDLNYRNPDVREAMLGVVRRWLAFGFDGLRLDIFYALFKDEGFEDAPFSPRPLPSDVETDGFFQSYGRILHHPDTVAFARTLRRVADEFEDPPRFLVGEAFGQPSVLRRYCEGGDGLHAIFLFKAMQTPFSASAFRALVEEFEREMPAPLVPTWVFGNHDRSRRATRVGNHPEREKLLAALQLSARGVPCIYNGEEIGMRDLDLPLATAKDPVAKMYRFLPEAAARALRGMGILLNRDACRTPMQWSAAPNAGFSAPGVAPWLPVHPASEVVNVESEARDPASLLRCYERLLRLRKERPALHSGTMKLYPESALPAGILAYRRAFEGDAVDVFLHFDDATRTFDLPTKRPRMLGSTYPAPVELRDKRAVLRPYEAILVAETEENP
jgi:alpha-glucosidase